MKPTEDEKQELIEAGQGAERLRSDPAFQRAVTAIRKAAENDLIALDSNDIANNIRLRAEIKAIDALCTNIALAIQRGARVAQD